MSDRHWLLILRLQIQSNSWMSHLCGLLEIVGQMADNTDWLIWGCRSNPVFWYHISVACFGLFGQWQMPLPVSSEAAHPIQYFGIRFLWGALGCLTNGRRHCFIWGYKSSPIFDVTFLLRRFSGCGTNGRRRCTVVRRLRPPATTRGRDDPFARSGTHRPQRALRLGVRRHQLQELQRGPGAESHHQQQRHQLRRPGHW